MYTALKEFDEEFANYFFASFESFYRDGDKSKVVQVVDDVLQPYGGRLFEGFAMGKVKTGGKSNDK